MSDVERLFDLIVKTFASSGVDRLAEPISVADLMRTVAPYRLVRKPLGITTAEDYEHLILRLVAGEGGFAATAPPESLARFRAEALLDHPDLHVLRQEAAAVVALSRPDIESAIGGRKERGFAPPTAGSATASPLPAPEHDVPSLAAAAPEPAWETEAPNERCSFCGGSLPSGRIVNFCPHCGQQLAELRCPRCHCDVEYGWRHCVGCGTALANP